MKKGLPALLWIHITLLPPPPVLVTRWHCYVDKLAPPFERITMAFINGTSLFGLVFRIIAELKPVQAPISSI